ncbi:MAG: arginine-tRNA-protein transferase [Bacteroidetes bacterium]|nr:arginine-tRNA-protein transferase [Bacteroidota bacterium]
MKKKPSLMPISEYFTADSVPPVGFDQLLEAGWRHFGEYFFRYDRQQTSGGATQTIVPLRVDLSRWRLSSSQKKNLKRNQDLKVRIGPTFFHRDLEDLFHRHRSRFTEHAPEALTDFLSFRPASVPVENQSVVVFQEDRLVAASFLDIGSWSTSSIYGVFDPGLMQRGLGIFTMLIELQFSLKTGKKYYYPGYATEEPSVYDYKKQFHGLERYSWETGVWTPAGRFF